MLKPLPGPGEPVASPCRNVCRMDPATGLCEGCRRTLDEIAAWGTWGEDRRRAVWAQLARRPPGPSPKAPA